jgi:hypothetical protein
VPVQPKVPKPPRCASTPPQLIEVIYRKVQDAQIIKRRTGRKENKRIQRERKQIADIKKGYTQNLYI